jgi:hypothetical protein
MVILSQFAVCLSCPKFHNLSGFICEVTGKPINPGLTGKEIACPENSHIEFLRTATYVDAEPITRRKQVEVQRPENNVPIELELNHDDITKRIAVCKVCIESTAEPLETKEITAYGPVFAKWIVKAGNIINEYIKSLRCKKCGCFCGKKSKYGSIMQRLSFGKINGTCPVIWPDGRSNWEHGEPLNKKQEITHVSND